MSAPDGIDLDQSRAVLIGTSAYTEGLEQMTAAATSLRRMEDLLVRLCGWPPAAVTSFGDLSTGDRRIRKVNELIAEAKDVLLFYYVGHGLLLPGDDLGLALTDTDADAALHLTTTYRLRTLREQLKYHCNARLRLIILDCCFAGIATRNAQGPGGLADRVDHASRIEGTYTWTASRASQQAVYEDGDGGLTYFTKILHEVIASGIPGKPSWLTLADVDLEVAQRFRELPLPNTPIRPEPTRLAVGGLPGQFPFAPNAAPSAPGPSPDEEPRQERPKDQRVRPPTPPPRALSRVVASHVGGVVVAAGCFIAANFLPLGEVSVYTSSGIKVAHVTHTFNLIHPFMKAIATGPDAAQVYISQWIAPLLGLGTAVSLTLAVLFPLLLRSADPVDLKARTETAYRLSLAWEIVLAFLLVFFTVLSWINVPDNPDNPADNLYDRATVQFGAWLLFAASSIVAITLQQTGKRFGLPWATRPRQRHPQNRSRPPR
jgi:hypothetical protein